MHKQSTTYKFSGIEEKKHKFIQDNHKVEYLLNRKPFYDKNNDTILINTSDRNITCQLNWIE